MKKHKLGFTAGNFDLLHPGYIVTFEEAKKHCEKFIIFLPDLRILGEDYLGKSFTGDSLPIEVLYTSRSHNWSTTKLKDLITKQTIKQNPNIVNGE